MSGGVDVFDGQWTSAVVYDVTGEVHVHVWPAGHVADAELRAGVAEQGQLVADGVDYDTASNAAHDVARELRSSQ